jgi:SAM-dependent methyltransferase
MAAITDLEVLLGYLQVDGSDIVDVGCGPGGLAAALQARGARVTGVEISDEQLAAARARDDAAGVTFAIGRAEGLPLADGSQDVVVFMRSLHHVPMERMTDALREARRVLRPGGAVWIAEPLPKGDHFAMVSLIEDETDARDAAQRAIAGASAQGLRREAGEDYAVGMVHRDLESFRRRMLQVDPGRGPLFETHRDELARLFARGGDPVGDDGSRCFLHAHRADLLRAV